MASGISSPWGYSPKMVANIDKPLEFEDQYLIGQLGLSSIPSSFNEKGDMVSPLTTANKNYYSAFGSKKGSTLLKRVNKDIKYLK